MPKKPGRRSDADPDPLVAFCRALPGATEDVKWDNDLVFSVGGKMFAAFALPALEPVGFKVEPMVFAALVGKNGIVPAPYAARFHWVSVTQRDLLPVGALQDFIAESHALVAAKLPRKTRERLGLPA
jgi:predicted DNA-binding protein (MmcQ/YjbR family)